MIKLSPIITETSIAAAQKNWYTFRAPVLDNKNTLRQEIEKTFKVNVLSIKTMVVKGKTKRSAKNRRLSSASDWKKVIVLLKEGQKIDLFELGGN